MNPTIFTKLALTRDLKPDTKEGYNSHAYDPIADRLFYNEGLIRLLHAGIGMSGETGEVLDCLKKTMMYGKKLDIDNLKEECGDILWYMAIMLDEIGSSFEEVMRLNHEKLSRRYPNGFTEKDALARADKAQK